MRVPLLILQLLLLFPMNAVAQGFALVGELDTDLDLDGQIDFPRGTTVVAGQDFGIGIFYTVGGSTTNPEEYPAGELLFTFGDATLLRVFPQNLPVGSECVAETASTGDNLLRCSWPSGETTAYTAGVPVDLTAPQVSSDTPLTITASIEPYDPSHNGTPGCPVCPQMVEHTLIVQSDGGGSDEADLETLIEGPDEVGVGQAFTYEVTIHNNGPDASGSFTMATQVPEGWELLSGTPEGGTQDDCEVSNNEETLECDNLGSLASGESVTISVEAQAGPEAQEGAEISAEWINDALHDPVPGNDTDTHELDVVEAPVDLALTCEPEAGSEPIEIYVGEEAEVICTITNQGAATDAGMTYVVGETGLRFSVDLSSDDDNVTCEADTCAFPGPFEAGGSILIRAGITPEEPGLGDITHEVASFGMVEDITDNNALAYRYKVLFPPNFDLGVTLDPEGALVLGDPFHVVVHVENVHPDPEVQSQDSSTKISFRIRDDVFRINSDIFLLHVAHPNFCEPTSESELERPVYEIECDNGVIGEPLDIPLTIFTEEEPTSSGRSHTFHIDAKIAHERPPADQDRSNDMNDLELPILDPAQVHHFFPGHEVVDEMIFTLSVVVSNVSKEEQTIGVAFTGNGTLSLEGVSDGDIFYPPDEDIVVIEFPLPAGGERAFDVVVKATGEGEGEICTDLEKPIHRPLCMMQSVISFFPLPDLIISPQPVGDDGSTSDHFVEQGEDYTLRVEISNYGMADSEASRLTLRYTDSEFIGPLPEGCESPEEEAFLDRDVMYAYRLDCAVGLLPQRGKHIKMFGFRAPVFDEDKAQLRYHYAAIAPVNPTLDEDDSNHERSTIIEISNKQVVTDVLAPTQAMPNEEIPVRITHQNRGEEDLEDLTTEVEMPGDCSLERVQTDGEFEIQDTLILIDRELSTGESEVILIIIACAETGSHETSITAKQGETEIFNKLLVIEVNEQPTCTVTKTASDPTPAVGDDKSLHYDIKVTSSQDLDAVVLTDPLPPGLRLPVAFNTPQLPRDCIYYKDFPERVVCKFSLQANVPRTFTVPMEPTKPGIITNIVEVCGVSTSTDIDAQDLEVAIDIPPTLEVGTFFPFFVTITNTGTEPAPNVVSELFLDPGDPGVVFQSSTKCDLKDRHATCSLGALGAGENTEVIVIAHALAQTDQLRFWAETTSEDGRFDEADAAVSILTREVIIGMALDRFGLPGGGKQADAFDIYLDGIRIADDLPTGSATPFQSHTLQQIKPRIDLTDANAADNSTPLASFLPNLVGTPTDSLAFSERTFLLFTDTPGDTLGLLLKKDARVEAQDPALADVFFVHASPDAPTVELRITGLNETIPILNYGETSPYLTLEPHVYRLGVIDAATGQEINGFRFDLSDRAGQAVALVLSGRASDASLGLVAFDGQGNEVTTPVEGEPEQPQRFVLQGNYPNPFNPSTTLRFDLPTPARVHVEVFDVLGRRVLTTPVQSLEAGFGRKLVVEGGSLASGVYVYRVVVDGVTHQQVRTGRMLLIK